MHSRHLVFGTLLALGSNLSTLAGGEALVAQPQPQQPVASLQTQIDELKATQERTQKDLKEIKGLLTEMLMRADLPVSGKPQDGITLNVLGESFKGSATARVAILEYSDFDCSYCARYANEVYPLLDHAYIQTGKVKYFFRDLPSPDHLNAMFKARVARCAGEQNKFWEAHTMLFQNQTPFDGPGLMSFSKELGLDDARFKACMGSDKYLDNIRRSSLGASQMRLTGTPAFIIGTLSEDGSVLKSVKVSIGALSYETFRNVLDDLLKPAKK